jgi:hypothetical protein
LATVVGDGTIGIAVFDGGNGVTILVLSVGDLLVALAPVFDFGDRLFVVEAALFTVLLDFDVVGVLFGFTILILEDDVSFERIELAVTVILSFTIGGFFERILEILTNVDGAGVLSVAEGSSLLTKLLNKESGLSG